MKNRDIDVAVGPRDLENVSWGGVITDGNCRISEVQGEKGKEARAARNNVKKRSTTCKRLREDTVEVTRERGKRENHAKTLVAIALSPCSGTQCPVLEGSEAPRYDGPDRSMKATPVHWYPYIFTE